MGARILAAAGVISALFAASGGFFHKPELVGMSGAIMFVGNLIVLFGRR